MVTDDERDALELDISRYLDGRLPAARRAEVEALLAASEDAAEIAAGYRGIGDALRAGPEAIPPDLLAKTLSRVATARGSAGVTVRVIRFARGLALAAALVLGASAVLFQSVRADDDVERRPTIEDEIRAASAADGDTESLRAWLAWRYLRRAP
jgi:anti-sigma factor RsiW